MMRRCWRRVTAVLALAQRRPPLLICRRLPTVLALAYGVLVVPMVGAFFIDIVNALVIKLYLMLPMFAG